MTTTLIDYKLEFSKIVNNTAVPNSTTTLTVDSSGFSAWDNILSSYPPVAAGVFAFYDSTAPAAAHPLKFNRDDDKNWIKSGLYGDPVPGLGRGGGSKVTSERGVYIPVWTYCLGYGIDSTRAVDGGRYAGGPLVNPKIRYQNVIDFFCSLGYIIYKEPTLGKNFPSYTRLYASEFGSSDYYALDWLSIPENVIDQQFSNHIIGVLTDYKIEFLKREDVPQPTGLGGGTGGMSLQLKQFYETWWAETLPTFPERFREICKQIYSTCSRQFGSKGFTGNFTDVDTEIGGKSVQYLLGLLAGTKDYKNGQISSNDGVFENFGFSEWLEENAPANLFDFTDDGDRDAVGLEEAAAQGNGFFKELATSVFTTEDSTEDDLLSFRQCALMTDILQDEADSLFSNYWSRGPRSNSNYWGTPLSIFYKDRNNPRRPLIKANLQTNINSPHYRIYPVDTAYDPVNFVNHASTDLSLMQRTFAPDPAIQNDTSPGVLGKDLYWVYEGSDELIHEKLLKKSSITKGIQSRQKLRELLELDRIYNSGLDPKALARARSRIKLDTIPSQADLPAEIDKARDDLVKMSSTKDQAFFSLKNVNIKYEGTNISTARKDVQVQLTWEVGDIGSLEVELATLDADDKPPAGIGKIVRLIDLVTLPLNNSPSVRNGASSWLSNQYSPNYSRLRLKVSPVEGDTQINAAEDTSTMIVDLTTIDHSITRDDDSGKVNFVINYRGFFETALDMPFNDVLASDDTINKRIQRQEESLDILTEENCDPRLVRKIMRMEQEVFSREAKTSTYSTILSKLERLNLIHTYVIDEGDFKASIVGNAFYAQKNLVDQVKTVPGGSAVTSSKDFKTLKETLEAEGETEERIADIIKDKKLLGLKNRFMFLGDIMWVALDCLYKRDSAEMRKHVNNLNIRFMVAPIRVPRVTNPDDSVIINPLSLPIDLSFFIRWFDENITKKGMSFYPVGSFIRDLIDKLVNTLIYDVCFSNLLPDENPAILRGQVFTSSNSNFLEKYPLGPLSSSPVSTTFGSFHPDENYGGEKLFPTSNVSSKILADTHYYVIYPLIPSFRRNQIPKNVKKKPDGTVPTLKDSPYTISLFTGYRNGNWNYLSNVSFSKVTSGNLREARYFNNSFGSLALLSNVYDLSFKFYRRKANTFLFPGSIINFYLLDFGNIDTDTTPPWALSNYGDSDPHTKLTTANVLGFGGYFIVKSVEYNLGESDNEFEISVTSKYLGSDAQRPLNREGLEDKRLEIPKECADAYNIVASRANELITDSEESFPLETRGVIGVSNKVPDLDENNSLNRAPSREIELDEPTTPTVQTSQAITTILAASLADYDEIDASEASGLSFDTPTEYAYDKDGKKQKGTNVGFDSVAETVAKTIQQANRTINSAINETIYTEQSNGYVQKVVISLQTDKSFTLEISEAEPAGLAD